MKAEDTAAGKTDGLFMGQNHSDSQRDIKKYFDFQQNKRLVLNILLKISETKNDDMRLKRYLEERYLQS